MSPILRVFRYTRRYPWLAASTIGFAVVATLMVIVFPGVTQRIIDDAIRGNRPELIVPLTACAVIAFLVQNLANGLRIVLNNTFEQKVIFDLRSDLYDHIQRLPLSWFDQRATGDIMTRVLEDVTAVERVPEASEPAPGTVNPQAPRCFPSASGVRYFCFCASLPNRKM